MIMQKLLVFFLCIHKDRYTGNFKPCIYNAKRSGSHIGQEESFGELEIKGGLVMSKKWLGIVTICAIWLLTGCISEPAESKANGRIEIEIGNNFDNAGPTTPASPYDIYEYEVSVDFVVMTDGGGISPEQKLRVGDSILGLTLDELIMSWIITKNGEYYGVSEVEVSFLNEVILRGNLSIYGDSFTHIRDVFMVSEESFDLLPWPWLAEIDFSGVVLISNYSELYQMLGLDEEKINIEGRHYKFENLTIKIENPFLIYRPGLFVGFFAEIAAVMDNNFAENEAELFQVDYIYVTNASGTTEAQRLEEGDVFQGLILQEIYFSWMYKKNGDFYALSQTQARFSGEVVVSGDLYIYGGAMHCTGIMFKVDEAYFELLPWLIGLDTPVIFEIFNHTRVYELLGIPFELISIDGIEIADFVDRDYEFRNITIKISDFTLLYVYTTGVPSAKIADIISY